MNQEILRQEVKKLVESPKGILAIDESSETCGKRFEKLGVENTEENRRLYREMLVTTPNIEKYISGYIVVEETAKQNTSDGKNFAQILIDKGIAVGITAYTGYTDFDVIGSITQKITQGLDDFDTRIQEYKSLGATFSKWRVIIQISDHTPTEEFLNESAKCLAKYAKICQDNDVVPIVEPEVLIDGNHDIDKCYDVMAYNFGILFRELENEGVYLPGLILKTSMVLAGKEYADRVDAREVAEKTLRCFKEKVPNEIGGIVFLSGGQSTEEATEHLRLMHEMDRSLPWALSFSYGRAIQQPALESWAKNPNDIMSAQKLLLEYARVNSDANLGK